MKQQSSRSAEGVAAIRAIEAQKPESVRICDDGVAHLLLPGGIGFAISKWIISSGIYDRIAPGAVPFIVVRERYIDDFLKARLSEGLDQVVILGAGFDTRAYRIPGIEQTRVFEVDHPATQAVKLERLKQVIDPLPAHVRFVAVDFNTQALGERLLAGGYDTQGKTLFIWQGVTYFLTAAGVDSTLAFIADHSGAGSTVIFDYFSNEMLNDSHNGYGKMIKRAAQMSGEEYLFGIDEGQVESFLSARGFADVQNATLDDLKRLYFTGANARRVVPKGIAIVSAVVKQR
ncbi:MAG: SAM-dependent methyltransferase [Chloroflexi bacterium]|nr:SAM-dependent methyltransferase [Chloroflexota bacterium]